MACQLERIVFLEVSRRFLMVRFMARPFWDRRKEDERLEQVPMRASVR